MLDEKVRVTMTGLRVAHDSGQSNQHQAQDLEMEAPFPLGWLSWYQESYLCYHKGRTHLGTVSTENGTVRDGVQGGLKAIT